MPIISAHLQRNTTGIENTFIFSEEGIAISSKGPMINSQTEMKYEMVCKVRERPELFYIYISKVQAYILLKKDIEDSKINDLRNLLQSKLSQDKYLIK